MKSNTSRALPSHEAPHPVVFLYNQMELSFPEFLVRNIPSLADSGYRRILLEMNHDISLDKFAQIVSAPAKSEVHMKMNSQGREFLNAFNEAQRSGIDVHFIDPQSFSDSGAVALRRHQMIESLSNSGRSLAEIQMEAAKEMEQMSQWRGEMMAETIEQQYREQEAHGYGIIVIASWGIASLVKGVAEAIPQAKFAVSADPFEVMTSLSRMTFPENVRWRSIVFQQDMSFYPTAAHVSFLKTSKDSNPESYEQFESRLGLLREKRLERATALSEIIDSKVPGCSFSVNARGIVSAQKECLDEQGAKEIARSFPEVSRVYSAQPKVVHFRGINLPENAKKVVLWGNKR